MIWATLGLSFYHETAAFGAAITKRSPSGVVNEVAQALLGGSIGAALVVLGVVILPIASGDTAFRARSAS